MRRRYGTAMAALHRACLWGAALGLIVITAIIPYGVFTRYVLGRGSQWPEPLSILVMIAVSFLSAAVCYRDNLHIAVLALPMRLAPGPRRALGWVVELAMLGTSLFMVVWGIGLVRTTWGQAISEFPSMSVGASYLPIPIGGAITALFAIEKLLEGRFFAPAADGAVASAQE
jgi:TRAP-type C4-dicarboxylate transport system permease small subunit